MTNDIKKSGYSDTHGNMREMLNTCTVTQDRIRPKEDPSETAIEFGKLLTKFHAELLKKRKYFTNNCTSVRAIGPEGRYTLSFKWHKHPECEPFQTTFLIHERRSLLLRAYVSSDTEHGQPKIVVFDTVSPDNIAKLYKILKIARTGFDDWMREYSDEN